MKANALFPQLRRAATACCFFLALGSFCVPALRGQLVSNLGGERAGVAGFTFLKTDLSPRAAAMAGAQNSVSGDGYAGNWNAAALCDLEYPTFAFANTFWIDGINHGFFSYVQPTKRWGTLALVAQTLATPPMERRTELQPGGTGEYFYASNTAVGISYSKLLTTRFSYGATLKYVNETLDRFVAQTALVDLGFLYRVGYKDLQFAVNLMHFGLNTKLQGDRELNPFARDIRLESYPSPSVFSMGISMVPWKNEADGSQLLTVLQVNHPSDNAANIRFGLEYGFRKLLYLRGGYKVNVDDNLFPTMGVGLRTHLGRHPVSIDYGADPLRNLGWRQRVGVVFSLNTAKREERSDTAPTAQ